MVIAMELKNFDKIAKQELNKVLQIKELINNQAAITENVIADFYLQNKEQCKSINLGNDTYAVLFNDRQKITEQYYVFSSKQAPDEEYIKKHLVNKRDRFILDDGTVSYYFKESNRYYIDPHINEITVKYLIYDHGIQSNFSPDSLPSEIDFVDRTALKMKFHQTLDTFIDEKTGIKCYLPGSYQATKSFRENVKKLTESPRNLYQNHPYYFTKTKPNEDDLKEIDKHYNDYNIKFKDLINSVTSVKHEQITDIKTDIETEIQKLRAENQRLKEENQSLKDSNEYLKNRNEILTKALKVLKELDPEMTNPALKEAVRELKAKKITTEKDTSKGKQIE